MTVVRAAAKQFIKYAVFGFLATVVQTGVFYLFAFFVWPQALDDTLADATRRNYAVYSNLAAFPFSNTFAYVTNALWVFTGGRHSRLVEFGLFQLVSFLSFGAGLLGGPQLIQWFGISTHLAQGGLIASSALFNFILRKFVIFAR